MPAAVLAIVSGLAWILKYDLIDANGGPLADAGTGTEALWIPLTYLVGLIALLAAGGLAAWALARAAPTWLRVVAAGAGAAAAFGLHRLMHAIGSALYTTEGWKRDEVSIWSTALIMLVAGIVAVAFDLLGRRSARSKAAPTDP